MEDKKENMIIIPVARVEMWNRNGSLAPNKANRSCTVKYNLEEQTVEIKTPPPAEKKEEVPPLKQNKDFKMRFDKLKSGYRFHYDINMQVAKMAGRAKIMAAFSEFVEAIFKEIEENEL